MNLLWTESEMQILKDNYFEHGSDIPALNRSNLAICTKANNMGLVYHNASKPWTSKEIAVLREKYPVCGWFIPELKRSRRAIEGAVRRFGIKKAKRVCFMCGEPHYAKGLCKQHYFMRMTTAREP